MTNYFIIVTNKTATDLQTISSILSSRKYTPLIKLHGNGFSANYAIISVVSNHFNYNIDIRTYIFMLVTKKSSHTFDEFLPLQVPVNIHVCSEEGGQDQLQRWYFEEPAQNRYETKNSFTNKKHKKRNIRISKKNQS